MRSYPDMEDKWDRQDVERLNAEPWMLELLRVNPAYPHWGPQEDYMGKRGNAGWEAPVFVESWEEFGPWELDDYNEAVHFYFSVVRDSEDCQTCGGDGYHPEARRVVDTFYAHMNPQGEHWNDKITQDEVDALVERGRVPAGSTAAEINAQNRPGARGLGHDAINRGILIERRLERLGLPQTCPTCQGHGSTYTDEAAHVTLTLWMLHPRKGASRGVEIQRITPQDLAAVRAFLEKAALRNAERFARLDQIGVVQEA